jgi:hypothetical protein
MKILEGTVLAHAKRHGWTQQVQVATRHLAVMRSFSTPSATATRPTVLVRYLATPQAAILLKGHDWLTLDLNFLVKDE